MSIVGFFHESNIYYRLLRFNQGKIINMYLFVCLAKEDVNDKILAYNRANRQVAILCNHQRAVPKTFEQSMENMNKKLQDKRAQIAEAENELKKAKTDLKNLKTVAAKK